MLFTEDSDLFEISHVAAEIEISFIFGYFTKKSGRSSLELESII